MRVLHATETAKGGVGTYLDELIPLQIEALGSGNVLAIVPDDHQGQLPSVPSDCLLPFKRPRRSLAALIDLTRQMNAALRDFRPDILHLHSTFAGAVGRLGARAIGPAKVIYTPHGWPFEMWPRGLKRHAAAVAERAMAARCDKIVAVSEAERRQGLSVKIPKNKVAVVLNGISADPPTNAPAEWNEQRLKVLFVGRLDRQKGFETVAAIASRHEGELVLRVIGTSVVSRSAGVLCGENIEHLGWLDRDSVDAHLQACDVVAMPSRWEGLSITALEAMRAAKPIVAFAVGGLPEAIEDGVTGRVVPPEDSAAFEDALLSATAAEWSEAGLAARDRFERLFTSQRMAAELLRLYASVMGDRGSKSGSARGKS